MFGHTFLRINSNYDSKLLSYAVNYAADADPSKENGFVFALKGLFGGYYGKYSLLPYYEKLKEYRDTEQRDIWEYDLNLTKQETLRMFRHMWELNGTQSNYYFFTKNCSYNMLWFLEAAREDINLRKYFTYQVIPLETVHAAKLENIITKKSFRPSKRTTLLKYEELINKSYIDIPQRLVDEKYSIDKLLSDKTIAIEQKRYIIESTIELLEYQYKRNEMKKDAYLKKFHNLSSARSTLGIGKKLNIKAPNNPLNGHRAFRIKNSIGYRDEKTLGFIGIRPAYHDLDDNQLGFLRGTQIEFLNFEFVYDNKDIDLERSSIFSVVSLAQRSEFFKNYSWRLNLGSDRDYLYNLKSTPIIRVGAGLSWGNDFGYIYLMADPFTYIKDDSNFGIGASVGFIIDRLDWANTRIELTHRIYEDKNEQNLANLSQNFRLSKNSGVSIKYDYIQKEIDKIKFDEETYKFVLNLYF